MTKPDGFSSKYWWKHEVWVGKDKAFSGAKLYCNNWRHFWGKDCESFSIIQEATLRGVEIGQV
jgi:hypothetical protein